MTDYKPHPYATIVPMLGAKDLQSLADDIRKNGLRESIVLVDDNLILDGRNRMKACELADLEPTFESFHGTRREMLAFVKSKNVERRHLDESQRAMAAASFLKAERELDSEEGDENRKIFRSDSQPKTTQADAAEHFNVSDKSVRAAQAVQERGADELIAAVESGEVSVSDAAAIADKPKSVQKKAVKAKREGKAKTVKKAAAQIAPEPRPEIPKVPVADRAALKKQRDEVFEKLAELDTQLAEIAAPRKGKTLKDSKGNLVPERLFKVFRASEHFVVARRAYGALSDAFTLAHRELPKGLIDPKEVDRLLLELYRRLEAAEPHMVCPKCMGDGIGCKPCGGYGFTRTGGQR